MRPGRVPGGPLARSGHGLAATMLDERQRPSATWAVPRPARLWGVAATALWLTLSGGPVLGAKNVLLFISDGASWGTWHMASYYQHGSRGQQPYDAFDLKLGMTTYPLNTARSPTHQDAPQVGYLPALAWDFTPAAGPPPSQAGAFGGYDYIRRDATDSAAAGTALATGVKTFNSAINVDNHGQPLAYITQHAKAAGKATGVVSSVPFTHATPASFGAQSISRSRYGEIGHQMIHNPALDLILGTGHPLYDGDGRLRSEPSFRYLSQADWQTLTGPASPRRLIQTRAEFEALADGSLVVQGPLLGLPQVHDTLQYSRSAAVQGADPARPSGVALIAQVPSLQTLTRAALRHLGRHGNGLFLMVEGGAVDWAAHANDTGRIIEEQIDFNLSVQAAVDWVQANSHWGETLIIVLTDHGNGMPMGPMSDLLAFDPVRNHGAGRLPGVRWHHKNHSNENTLLWAHGAGADDFKALIKGIDPGLVHIAGHNRDGRFVTNTDVFAVMRAALARLPAAAR